MHSLRERLQRKRAHLKGIPFQSAACFPFLDFSLTSEEWHGWQVIDRRDLEAQPIVDLIAGAERHPPRLIVVLVRQGSPSYAPRRHE